MKLDLLIYSVSLIIRQKFLEPAETGVFVVEIPDFHSCLTQT